MRRAIAKQLKERNIDLYQAEFNMDDTITNPNYYSNAESRRNPAKSGRNFAGLFYPQVKVKVNVKTR